MSSSINGNSPTTKEIEALEEEYVNALLQQNVPALDRLLADDFTFVEPTGARFSKSEFLGQISSGNLIYTTISPSELEVCVYGDAAVAMDRSTVKGSFKGHAFGGQFRGIDVFAKRDGRWLCVVTQETSILASPS